MQRLLKRFERYIVLALLGMMTIVVFLGTVELAVILIEQVLKPPHPGLVNIEKMMRIFGFFMMILIGLELMETMKVYLSDEQVHAEIILLVAIIALARKMIVMDYKALEPLFLLGNAAVLLSLSIGYYMIKKASDAGK
jgi:uncharacterized membrane protein (DUF373 family)